MDGSGGERRGAGEEEEKLCYFILPADSRHDHICTLKTPFQGLSERRISFYKKKEAGVPGWLSQLSILLLISAQVMISRFVSSSPESGSVLTVWSLLGISLSLPLSAPPPLVLMSFLSLSVSQNK